MASKTLGRIACPIGCGHTAAFVKLKTDKGEDKRAYPYVHCAACGVQLHTRSQDQAEHLLKNTRAEKGADPAPEPRTAPPGDERAPADTSAPPAPPKAAGGLLAGWLLGGNAA